MNKLLPTLCLFASLFLASFPLTAARHAVILSGGVWVDLAPGAATTSLYYADDINASGTIAGAAADTVTGDLGAFRYSSNVLTPFAVEQWLLHDGVRINASGQVAGTAPGSPSNGVPRAVLYNAGVSTYLFTLAADQANPSFATGINDSGTIVGCVGQPPNGHAFSFSGGTETNIGSNKCAFDINSSGVVVGISYPPGDERLFTYASGVTTDLGSLGPYCGRYYPRINDAGVIVFGPFYYDGTRHAIPKSDGDECSAATAINGNRIVGYGAKSHHPWLYTIGGSLVDLGLSESGGGNYIRVVPLGINSMGQVVGWADDLSTADR